MDTLTDKYKTLSQEITQRIIDLLETKGVKSEHRSSTVLIIKKVEQMYILGGGRWLTEITPTELIDNQGYSYNLCALSVERLCLAIDSITENN